MYKRTLETILNQLPPDTTCVVDTQFAKAKYSTDVSFTLASRTNRDGATYLFIKRKHTEDTNVVAKPSNYYDTENFYYEIRRMTPKEYFIFMGLNEEDADKLVKSNISDSQLYKMAGNSIVTTCLGEIYTNLFVTPSNITTQKYTRQLTLFDSLEE